MGRIRGVFVAALLLCFFAGEAAAQRQTLLEYPSIHSPKVGLQGMVVSQNEIASAVGSRILAEGGNAIDAAVLIDQFRCGLFANARNRR